MAGKTNKIVSRANNKKQQKNESIEKAW